MYEDHLTISISVGPKPGRRSRVEADLSNQLKIDTYFTAYSTPTTSVKYKVRERKLQGLQLVICDNSQGWEA